MKRNLKTSVSILFGVIFFALMLPLQFDRYIPVFHSIVSIVLCAASSLIFSFVLYKLLNNSLLSDGANILLYFLVILGIAHGIYTVMFFSSIICLALILIVLISTGVILIKNKIRK
ncbi:MAG: hypothetical protein IJ027_07585 [Oscillospiraceae bacterium]|nr:hypothetical protein [Oscillospiraceae bacterium]